MSQNRFKNQVVVVTGASAGVGRAVVRAFAREGADVAVIARGTEGLEAAAEEVRQCGGRALAVPLDVAEVGALESAADRIERELGPISIWVNDAMTSVFSPVKEMKAEEFKRVTEVTYLGFVYGTLAALKYMLPRNRGKIIQVGSALAYRGIPLQAAYCASKHAIQGFMDSLRSELLHDRSAVTVTMVQMPALNTPQFTWVKSRLPRKPQPVPPIYQPEVAASAILHAALSKRREIWVGTPTLMAIIGNRIMPGLLDHYLARTNFRAQQTQEPADPNRADNLWKPISGDHGAHGPFDDRARSFSWQLWADENRKWLLAALAAGVAATLAGVLLGSKRRL